MENGLFPGEALDLLPSQLPLPFEMPPPPNLSHLSPEILKSSAIESLIQTNEDLMARLRVTLRRISQVESSSGKLEAENRALKARLEQVRDQILILKEKEGSVQSRQEQLDQSHEMTSRNLKILELKYQELVTTAKEQRKILSQQLKATGSRLQRHIKYRRRIKTPAKILQRDCRALTQECTTQAAEILRLRSQIGEIAARLQQSHHAHLEERTLLSVEIENTHQKLNSATEALALAEAKIETLNSRLTSIAEERIRSDNSLIELQRRLQTDALQSRSQMEEITEKMLGFKAEASSSQLEVESLRNCVEEKDKQLRLSVESNESLRIQVETLQSVWRQDQEKVQKLEIQMESLQKLNQTLSQHLLESRKATEEQVRLTTAKQFAYDQRLREMAVQLKALKRGGAFEFSITSLNRIQSLLSEIDGSHAAMESSTTAAPKEL